jgi:SagB-type dehydrogenase family enzyme
MTSRSSLAPETFRQNRDLLFQFGSEGLMVTDPRIARQMVVDARIARVLLALDRWTTSAQLAARLGGLTPRETARVLDALEANGLVQRRTARARAVADTWTSWGPYAAAFHFLTRAERYAVTPKRVEAGLRRKARTAPRPAPVLRRDGAKMALPPASIRSGGLVEALTRRRTWRRFGRRPLPLQDLADLLGVTFGVQQWAHGAHGRVPLKTSPSGGACHPLEPFVLARRVSGLTPGYYHYEADRHRLTLIHRGASTAAIDRCLQAQPWLNRAALLVFICAVFARTAWRYHTPRAYRSILIEAGHLGQTFCLLATDRGLAPFCTLAIDDAYVDGRLGLDGREQGVLYVVGCGTAPRAGWKSGVPFPKEAR